MDKTQIKEIIKDFEKISRIVNSRLEQLYVLLGEEREKIYSNQSRSQIKDVIEQQRKEMMGRVEEMRKNALSQIQGSINNPLQDMTPITRKLPTDINMPPPPMNVRKIEKIIKDNKKDDDN